MYGPSADEAVLKRYRLPALGPPVRRGSGDPVGGGIPSSCWRRPTAQGIATASPIRRSTFRWSTRRSTRRRFRATPSLIDAQGRLMLSDEVIASVARLTSLPLEAIFFAGYLLSVALIWVALVLIGRRLSATPWVDVALLAALTLRHRIPRTSANSFEPYFHPRMLAFGVGLLAVASLFAAGCGSAIALVGGRGGDSCHHRAVVLVLIGVALVVLEPALRRLALAAAMAAAVVGAWALIAGPLRTSGDTDGWGVACKRWRPRTRCLPRMASVGVDRQSRRCSRSVGGPRPRQSSGRATVEDGALVWGATALVGVFLFTLPLVVAHWRSPCSCRSRACSGWWMWSRRSICSRCLSIGGSPEPSRSRWYRLRLARRVHHARRASRSRIVLDAPGGVAVGGRHALAVAATGCHPCARRSRARVEIRHECPCVRHARCFPGGCERFGDCDLLARGRHRVVERATALGDFTTITPDRARALATKYDLNYLVTEGRVDLPIAYENSQFRIYVLR